ncbi:MAG: HAD-IIIA family hydrolase [Candidatus Omnitrophota bacterium]
MDTVLTERIKKIKLLVLDIDGVMTDGRIVYGPYGEEVKFFDVHDGLGIALLRRAGIQTAVVTARKSRIVRARCKDLGIKRVYAGFPDKSGPFNKILRKFRLSAEEVCFVGDDLIDLPVIVQVGFSVAVSNAVEEVRERAHYITGKKGGRGAVREITDLILKTQGIWERATSRFFE